MDSYKQFFFEEKGLVRQQLDSFDEILKTSRQRIVEVDAINPRIFQVNLDAKLHPGYRETKLTYNCDTKKYDVILPEKIYRNETSRNCSAITLQGICSQTEI